LIYDDSQGTGNASAELRTVNAVGRLVATMLLTNCNVQGDTKKRELLKNPTKI
jgi:hypothetical protein